ncbi:MAG: acyltransferase domain-containing protein, partial [Polyangiaceae bacterium]|nr:acyltransferase domain-containing protein [Polyangiaceae bacterium]
MSSRTLDFAAKVREITGGAGVDVVLNALTGPFIDAGLSLLGPGGFFLEVGKSDIRSKEWLAEHAPGVRYEVYDVGDAPPEQLQAMLSTIAVHVEADELPPLPYRAWPLEHAVEAFRYMAQARHTGKILLLRAKPPALPVASPSASAPARADAPSAEPNAPIAASRSTVVERLRRATGDERPALLASELQALAAKTLGSSNAAAVSTTRPLQELGFDSLMAAEYGNLAEHMLGAELPSTLVFDYPTIGAQADFLLRDVLKLTEAALAQPEVASFTATAAAPLDEPIAIIGVGCRFPGGVRSADDFWQLLREGRDAITEVPATRWDADAYYDPDPDADGKMVTRWGGFLEGVDRFDATFFGLTPREAIHMDPQQRVLLEVTYEALEHAGIAPDRLMGSETGVFVGLCSADYQSFSTELGVATAYTATGNAHSVAAGRLSYLLGLRGPSIAVDTACSSSLVALHLACQSLRMSECRAAVAGGITLILRPDGAIHLSRFRAMSPTGRCHTFDASADGYVRSEGCGMVVLKRLSDALRDGDRVLAVIRGSAVNQDGRSNGLTAPNGPSQQDVIRRALLQGGVAPCDVDYVEVHGTGTPLGDPIEVQALAAVLGQGRPGERPVVMSAVKTNIGHTEGAAGVASLIKAVLCLQKEAIPPTLHVEELNPRIAWTELPVRVAREMVSWPRGERRRFAGVSSFGFSGTNAHVIVEEAPSISEEKPAEAKAERPVHVIAWSGRSAWSQRRRAEQIAEYLAANPTVLVADVAHTLGACRDHFEKRAAAVCASTSQLMEGIQQWLKGEGTAHVMTGPEEGVTRAPRVAMVFTGQGSQHAGMGRALFEKHPVFRASMERCAALFDKHLSRSLLSVMYPPEGEGSPLDDTTYTQPALFALEWSLFELWRSWGIEPVAVLGHSIGEVVAACAAGVLTLEDAVTLVVERSGRMGRLPAGGAMASVGGASERIEAIL